MGKANRHDVESLHSLLVGYYQEQLASGEELSSGTLAAINTFLKNNDIKVDVVDANPLQDLTRNLQELVERTH